MTQYAHCDRRGIITFSDEPDIDGLIMFAEGEKSCELVKVRARKGYNGQLLVPGVPEAMNDGEALNALVEFERWVWT